MRRLVVNLPDVTFKKLLKMKKEDVKESILGVLGKADIIENVSGKRE